MSPHNPEEISEAVEDLGLEPELGPFAAEEHAGMGQDIDVFSADGGTLLYTENDRGWSRLLAMDPNTGERREFDHPEVEKIIESLMQE